MKTIKSILTILLIVAIAACDKVEGPYKVSPEPTPIDTANNNNNNSDTNYVFDATRRVLVEDYTGHECGNCPEAAEKLHELMTIYGDKVVPMAVHAGFFAETASAPFALDLRSTEGTSLDAAFGNSIAGNPNGMIGRKGYPSTHILNLNSWNSVLSSIVSAAPNAVLAIKNKYNVATTTVETKVYTKFKTNLLGNYKLCIYLLEDSIIGAQKDYRLAPASTVILDYRFDHVLRGSFNTAFGETIATDPQASEILVYRKSYTLNLTGKLLGINNPCYVMAYLYNDVTKEVIQASIQKIK